MFNFAMAPQTKIQLLKNSFSLYKKTFLRTVPFVFLCIFLLFAGIFIFTWSIHAFNLASISTIKTAAAKPIEQLQISKPIWLAASAIIFFVVEIYVWFLLSIYCYYTLNQVGHQQKISFFAAFKIALNKFFILLSSLITYSFFIAFVEAILFGLISILILLPTFLLTYAFPHFEYGIILVGHRLFSLVAVALCFMALVYLLVPFAFAFIAILFENAGPISVVGKTIRLVYKKWWRVFWILFLAGLVYAVFGIIFGTLQIFHLLPHNIIAIAQTILIYVFFPWMLSVKLAIYYDLKK